MPKVKYTQKDIERALRILKKNDFNYAKTCQATGIARSSLYAWVKKSNLDPIKIDVALEKDIDYLNEAVIPFAPEVTLERDDLISEIVATKKIIIDRIKHIAPKSTNLDALGRVFQLLDQCHKSYSTITSQNNQQINLVTILSQEIAGNTDKND